MQRPGGSADGKDLAAKGLKGQGLGQAQKLTEVDKKYETLSSEGKLKSTPFSMPWTNQDTAKLSTAGKPAVAGKTAAAKPGAARVGAKKDVTPEEPPKKKGFFGLF